jgi:hypothetical protein
MTSARAGFSSVHRVEISSAYASAKDELKAIYEAKNGTAIRVPLDISTPIRSGRNDVEAAIAKSSEHFVPLVLGYKISMHLVLCHSQQRHMTACAKRVFKA